MRGHGATLTQGAPPNVATHPRLTVAFCHTPNPTEGSLDDIIDRVGATAFHIAYIRAMEKTLPDALFDDPYAHHFHHEGTARQMEQYKKFAIFLLCIRLRTRWGDDLVKRELDKGTKQVVTLGAGFDCRALRLARPGVTFYDVDRDEVLAFTAERLEAAGVEPKAVRVAADYSSPKFVDALVAAGVNPSRRTLFLWEGNTFYLPSAVVQQVPKNIAAGFKEPVIAFDYFGSAIIEARSSSPTLVRVVDVLKSIGAPWKGSIDDLGAFASNVGLKVLDDQPVRALAAQYMPKMNLGPDTNSEVGFGVLGRA